MKPILLPLLLSLLLPASLCGRGPCGSSAEAGTCGLRPPLRSIHSHLSGFHFYNGDPARQLEAQHYCARVSPEVMQCVIYDADREGARLVGIEYIVSARVFKALPEAEKKLWHSHRFEVMSGQLVAPGLKDAEEKSLMQALLPTYGKTWQTWQVDRDAQVPMGIPQLLMGFTADGQVDPKLVAGRDRALGIATAAKKAARADLAAGPVEPGADAWRQGEAAQLELGWVRGPVPFSGK